MLTSAGKSTIWNCSFNSGIILHAKSTAAEAENIILYNKGLFSFKLSINGCPLQLIANVATCNDKDMMNTVELTRDGLNSASKSANFDSLKLY